MPNKIVAWVNTHKPQAALGAGAVGAVGIGLYKRHKNSGGATPGTAAGVPTAATTAAGVVPGGGDSAGGVPFDSGAFDTTASTYLAQISQGLSDLNGGISSLSTDVTSVGGQLQAVTTAQAAESAALGTIASQTAPHTGGVMTKAPAAVKPKRKATKATPVAHHTPPPPAHKPTPKRKPAARKTTKRKTPRKPARARL